MLTSSAANQYLRPDYLSPLPTTLDAKKSPLALLAQTCSQIGADSPNTKLIASSDKSKSSKQSSSESRDKMSPSSSISNNSASDLSVKSSFKPYDLNVRDKSRTPEERASSSLGSRSVRTPMSMKSSTGNLIATPGGRCASNQSASSPRSSPAERKTPASHSASPNNSNSSESDKTMVEPTSISSSSSKLHGYSGVSVYTSAAADSAVHLGSSYKTSPSTSCTTANTTSATCNTTNGSLLSGIPVSSSYLGSYPGHGLPMPIDLMASSLMAQHHHALKTGALNPYLEYARLKNSVAASPVCRDPYCTGCSLNSHLLATTSSASGKPPTSSCPAGCTQCDHGKTGYLTHTPAAAAYAHAQLAALAAASQLPYICNWIAGDGNYCGKRFSSSDELLQHLRNHTSLSSLADSNAALSMLSASNLPPTHPLLHRTYPTPPLSPLATARYHPYSKPSLLPPSLAPSSLAGFSLPPHPGLPPYFSPYSLYGPRLGAASGMHP